MNTHPKLKTVAPVPIQLVDEDFDDDDDEQAQEIAAPSSPVSPRKKNPDTWATDVHLGICTIVVGQNGQKFAVWPLSIDTAKGGHIKLLKRYSEFDKLRQDLLAANPSHHTEIPKLPPKKVFGNLSTSFLNKRRRGLEYFISCVLLNPVLGNSEIVKQFVSKQST